MISKRYEELVRQRGVPLAELGIAGSALVKRSALEAVRLLEEEGIVILGGDVFNFESGRIRFAYANWYCDPPGEDGHAAYVRISAEVTRSYITKYPDAEDGTIFYRLVFNEDQENQEYAVHS